MKPKTIVIPIKDSDGNVLNITLSRLTRAGNREFASLIRPIVLRNCEMMVSSSPSLKGHVDDVITSLAATGGEIPSMVGGQAALAPEGMEILVRIMTRANHPVPIDDITIQTLMEEYYGETFQAVKELLPIPNVKAAGPM